MWGACLKPNVQVDSNRDCVTQARGMLQVKHNIWLDTGYLSDLHTDMNLPLSFPLYTCSKRDQNATYALGQRHNSSFVRRGWEFDKIWSIRPGLYQQRFILIQLLVQLHRMGQAPTPCSSSPLLHLYGFSASLLYKSFLFAVTSNTNV